MKKRILKVVMKVVFAPLSLAVWMMYTAGCILKSVSYLTVGDIEEADGEIDKAYKYE